MIIWYEYVNEELLEISKIYARILLFSLFFKILFLI